MPPQSLIAVKWQLGHFPKNGLVVGMKKVTANVLFEQRTLQRGFIDVAIADAKTVIEQKSLGVDLNKINICSVGRGGNCGGCS